CKKTKTFGLVLLFHLQDRVAHFVRDPAPYQQANRYAVVGDIAIRFYLILLKKHRCLSRTLSSWKSVDKL
ncbi:hypothetical protein, partial [Hoylesella loescheii]